MRTCLRRSYMENLTQKKTTRTLRILYPIWMVIGVFSLLYVPSQIFADDAIETAQNVKANELLFRLGVAARLLTQLLGIVIPLLLFVLFKSYDRNSAAVMLVLSLLGVPISMYGEAHNLLAISFLDSPELMMQHLDISGISLNIASIFWGLWLLPLGYLAHGSGLFPKVVGYALYIGGLGYLLGAFLKILALETDMVYSITEYMTMGEVVFILWFVIRGVRSISPESEVPNEK
jgi:hypothetical protein